MSILLAILAGLTFAGGALGFLTNLDHPTAALPFLLSGLVGGALLGGFARAISLLERILERTPEVPGSVESTWVPMLPGWRVGSRSVSGGGYQAIYQKEGAEPIALEQGGQPRLFQTRALAHQEAEVEVRRLAAGKAVTA